MYDYNYGYDYGYGSTDVEAVSGILGGMAVFGIVGVIMSIIGCAIGLLMLISLWKIYKKAGKKGWESIVPIYNIIVLIQIVELPMWYIVLFLVPFANIYAMFKIYIELAHKFGKSTGFGVATVFFSIVCLPMLAFGKDAVYNGGNNVGAQVNNNTQPNQYNPSATFQNGVNDVNNNSNSNAPFVFDQNINTQINPIPTVQGEQPMLSPIQQTETQPANNGINPTPEFPQTNSFSYNANPIQNETENVVVPTNTIPTDVNVETQPMPVEPIQVQQPQFTNEVPSTQPIDMQPQMVNPEPQMNVIPGMGTTPQPVTQPQNPNNNPNNTIM